MQILYMSYKLPLNSNNLSAAVPTRSVMMKYINNSTLELRCENEKHK